MKVCAEPGCPRLGDDTRCTHHTKAKRRREDKRRPSASQRGYGAKWANDRREFLRLNPICMDCGAEATVPDHSPLTRAELVAGGITHPDDFVFLQPRCKPCHDRKTARDQPGGWNAR